MRLSVILFLLLFVNLSTFGQEGFRGEHFIEVIGTAEMELEPNEITLLIRLKEYEENRQEVKLEQLDKDFLNALKAADIDRKRLELADAGTTLSKFGKRDKEAFRQKSYQLKLTGARELENFLAKIEPVQVDLVSIIKVHHTELEKLKLDVKIQALKAARAKAEILIKAINGELGKTLMIREWETEPVQPMMDYTANVFMRKGEEEMAQSAPEVASFRKIKLRGQVATQFEIK